MTHSGTPNPPTTAAVSAADLAWAGRHEGALAMCTQLLASPGWRRRTRRKDLWQINLLKSG